MIPPLVQNDPLPIKNRPTRILLVEDSEDDELLLKRQLRRDGMNFVSRRVDTPEAMKDALQEETWDIIVSDYCMPRFNALHAMEVAKENGIDVPFIVVSGTIGEDVAVAAMRAGANDYVMKDKLARLAPAITRELDEAEVKRARVKAESSLKETEGRFGRVFENSPVGLMIYDAEGMLCDLNRAARQIFGINKSIEELHTRCSLFRYPSIPVEKFEEMRIGKTIKHEGWVSFDNADFCDCMASERTGSAYLITTWAPLGDDLPPSGFLGVYHDMTERKRVEDELVQLAAAVEAAAESIILTDAEGKIQYVNPFFEKMTGYTRDEVIGSAPGMLQSGKHDEAFYSSLWETISKGNIWKGHFTNRRKDGTIYEEEAVISPVKDGQGNIIHYVSVKRDVTQEMALEGQLRQSQKMEAIGRLAGGIAHDFTNMLLVIMQSAQLIKAQVEDRPDVSEFVNQIIEAGQRASALTGDLLAFSHRQRISVRERNINDVLRGIEGMLRRSLGDGVEFALNTQDDPLVAKLDAALIEQVLVHMTVNAQDAMPDGGNLLVESYLLEVAADETIPLPGSACNMELEPGRYGVIAVTDTGIGMDASTMSRIFDPFFTTKGTDKSTGLGLSTAYGIITQHGGALTVYSNPGKGSTFKIFMPLLETPDVQRNGYAAQKPGGTILLTEDNPMVRANMTRLLQELGYKVFEARSASEAMQVLKNINGAVDLVVSDFMMEETNGREFAKQMHRSYPDLPVLFASGYTPLYFVTRGLLSPNDAVLTKPFSKIRAAKAIRDILVRQGAKR